MIGKGLNIIRSTTKFFKNVFLKNIKTTDKGSVLLSDAEGKIAKSSIRLEKDKLNIGSKNNTTYTIQRARTASGDGVGLTISAGDGIGTDKSGGDLILQGGVSTGNTNGGELYFQTTPRDGSSDANPNSYSNLFYTYTPNSELRLDQLSHLRSMGEGDFKISSELGMDFIIDIDNDTGAGQYFTWKDYTTWLATLEDNFKFTIHENANTRGLVLDGANHVIKAGDRATNVFSDIDTTTGGVNTAGVNLTIAGGAGTGTGAGGGISFGTFPAGSSGFNINTTYEEKMAMDKDGNFQIDGNLTPAGIVLDGNTITGVDDSGEFTNDDAHIMTSAAIEDKILGYGYGTGDITSVSLMGDDFTSLQVSSGDANFTIAGGEGIDTSGSGSTLTIAGEDASTSNKGVVELATTAEADTGTDTARAVTPAGLKSHVDARYHYQYISFLGNSTVQANGDWEFPGGNGISNHTWTIDSNQNATTVGSTTISVAQQYQHAGIRVPYAGKLVGMFGAARNANGDRQPAAALFVGVPAWGTTNSINATLRSYAAANNESGSYQNRASKIEDLTRDFDLSAGDIIYPAIRGDGTTADTIQISMTVVIKTLIP